MKNRIVQRFLSALLVLAMLGTVTGCSESKKVSNKASKMAPMEIEEVYKQSYDIIGGDDVMPIAGYYGPHDATICYDGERPLPYVSDEMFQMIQEVGVNILTASPDNYDVKADSVRKQLELGEKYGIGLFVTDEYLTNHDYRTGKLSTKDVASRLAEYMDYPAFAGLYLVDEPTSKGYLGDVYGYDRGIETYEKLTDIVSEELQIDTYINLLKVTGSGIKEEYEEYVKGTCELMNADFLCCDFYIFDEPNRGMEGLYLWNIATLRKYAEEYEIPFWNFIAAGSQWADESQKFDSKPYTPTEGEFNWSVNVNLAFGAKGLCYFPLLQPMHFAYAESTLFDFQRNGLIGAWGNKTQWYYYAQNVNKHIGVIDEVLMNSKNKGVLVTGEESKKDAIDLQGALLEGNSWRELAGVEGDALIGCFNYQGRTALYVVNYSTEYAQDLALQFQDTYNVQVVQGAETTYMTGDCMTLKMKAGEGALLVFE